MHARYLGGDGGKGPAAWAAGLRVPRLKLAGRAAKPQQDAMFLRLFRFGGEGGIFEKTREAGDGGYRSAGEPFQEKPTMEFVLVRAALTRQACGGFARHGIVRNSALVMSAQSRSRTAPDFSARSFSR